MNDSAVYVIVLENKNKQKHVLKGKLVPRQMCLVTSVGLTLSEMLDFSSEVQQGNSLAWTPT